MKKLIFLLCTLLAACSQSPNNPGNGGTLISDSFKVSFSPLKDAFFVGIGETSTLTVSVDITKPAEVAQLELLISSGVTYLSISPLSKLLRDGDKIPIHVTVAAEAAAGDKPFFTVTVQGVDASGKVISGQEQVRQDFQWVLP